MDAHLSFDPPTTAHIAGPGNYVVSPADPFLEVMQGADGFDLVCLATRAIRRDPGCIDARLVLAGYSQDLSTRLRHLEAAVAAGEWLWTPVAERIDSDLCWWGDIDTRPYMRAVQALGLALQEAGCADQSRACFDRLLTMNPNDDQGIRYLIDDPNRDCGGPRFR
jgi:hypothetical protein